MLPVWGFECVVVFVFSGDIHVKDVTFFTSSPPVSRKGGKTLKIRPPREVRKGYPP